MYQPNFERIARKIVRESLQVQPGEQGLLNLRSDTVPYGELIAAEIYRVGGIVNVLLDSDELKYRQIMETPLEQLALPWAPNIAAIHAVDFCITVGLHEAEPERFQELPPERLHAYTVRRRKRSAALYREGGPRWLGTDYPTRYMAQAYGIPWGRMHEMYWRAMDVDYGLLRDQTAAVGEKFDRAEQIRIVTGRGTDLRLRRDDRHVFRDDGLIRDAGNLPAGEVFFAPVEDSAEGRVVFDQVNYQGQRIVGLELRFEDGVATPVKAESGFDIVMQQWNLHSGDKDRIGEVGVGLNQELPNPIGYDLTDQKVLGLVHLTLGAHELAQSQNRSTMRWPMLMLQATIYVNDEPILDRGRLAPRLLR
jgi:aminopeptidase